MTVGKAKNVFEGTRGCTAMFTGHRIISKNDLPTLTMKLIEVVTDLSNRGIIQFCSGMARGFDVLATKTVIRAREVNRNIRLIAVLPCANQDELWRTNEKVEYRSLLEQADEIVHVSHELYFDGCMKARNLHLVENSGVCVAYLKHKRSGTSQTVRFANEQGLEVINMAEML